jgi:hypothetical protein
MCSSSLEEESLVVMLVTYGTLLQIFSTSRKFNNHDFCVLLDESSVVNGKEFVIDKGKVPICNTAGIGLPNIVISTH